MNSTGLHRVLTLPAVTFIAIGFMIGGGVFVFTGIVLKITGNALPLAYALAVIPVFISMMPLAMLGATLPTTGANYMYPSRMVSPGLAFTGIWVYALASFFGQIPLYAISCARYIEVYMPGVSTHLVAAIIVTLLYLVNLRGIKIAAQVQAVMVIVLLSSLLYYSINGTIAVNSVSFSGILDHDAGSLLLGTSLLTFTYFGANGIIELGGEIIDPGRVIPRAFMIAFPVVGTVYVLVALTTVGCAPMESLLSSAEPLITSCKTILGSGGTAFFIIGGAILALVTTLNALFIVGTKSLLMIVEDDILPEKAGLLHKKYATPHVLLTLIWILSIAGIYSGVPLETLASYAALGGLIIFLPVLMASLRLPVLYPRQFAASSFTMPPFFRWFCAIVGILMVIFFGMVILVDLGSPVKTGGFVIFILTGIGYYLARKSYCRSRGINFDNLLYQEGWTDIQ